MGLPACIPGNNPDLADPASVSVDEQLQPQALSPISETAWSGQDVASTEGEWNPDHRNKEKRMLSWTQADNPVRYFLLPLWADTCDNILSHFGLAMVFVCQTLMELVPESRCRYLNVATWSHNKMHCYERDLK